MLCLFKKKKCLLNEVKMETFASTEHSVDVAKKELIKENLFREVYNQLNRKLIFVFSQSSCVNWLEGAEIFH